MESNVSDVQAGIQFISEALEKNDSSLLMNYEKRWKEKFGKEFEKQSYFPRCNNKGIKTGIACF